VSRVVPRGSALAVARELCARIEEAAPTAVRASLRVSREVAVPGRTSRSVDEVAFSEDLLDRLS
jgi:enoyl-CoA hydratase/carnithine racemase